MKIYFEVWYHNGKAWNHHLEKQYDNQEESLLIVRMLLGDHPGWKVRVFKFIPLQIFDSEVDIITC